MDLGELLRRECESAFLGLEIYTSEQVMGVWKVIILISVVTIILDVLIWLSIHMTSRNACVSHFYYIAWENNRNGIRGYTSWTSKNPDDALYTFRCKFPGHKILACTTDVEVAKRRINQYPWN